jgi:hypothetical protein
VQYVIAIIAFRTWYKSGTAQHYDGHNMLMTLNPPLGHPPISAMARADPEPRFGAHQD